MVMDSPGMSYHVCTLVTLTVNHEPYGFKTWEQSLEILEQEVMDPATSAKVLL